MDDNACNYLDIATEDDGSCLFIGNSCDDGDEGTMFDNINENCECTGLMTGCTYPDACNYDELAVIDNGSCYYVGDVCDDGDDMTFDDLIGDDCACAGTPFVFGCTYPSACNYNELANEDDGSCQFEGDSCDDGDPLTINDELNENCECVGEVDAVEENTLSFMMFPNPASDELTLQGHGFQSIVSVQILDAAGRVVMAKDNLSIQHNAILDVSSLSSGAYSVKVSDDRARIVRRLTIQR